MLPSGLTAMPRGRTSPGLPEIVMVSMTSSVAVSTTVMSALNSLAT